MYVYSVPHMYALYVCPIDSADAAMGHTYGICTYIDIRICHTNVYFTYVCPIDSRVATRLRVATDIRM
jgi:hypothetical protein